MHNLLIVFIVFLSLSLQAQDDIFDQKSTQVQRELDLLNFIKSDMELYEHYKSGKSNLSVAKGFGYTTVVFLILDATFLISAYNSSGYDGLGYAILFGLSSIATVITGTIALIFQAKGKGKIKDVMNYARNELGHTYSLNLKMTKEGLGIVYSF